MTASLAAEASLLRTSDWGVGARLTGSTHPSAGSRVTLMMSVCWSVAMSGLDDVASMNAKRSPRDMPYESDVVAMACWNRSQAAYAGAPVGYRSEKAFCGLA